MNAPTINIADQLILHKDLVEHQQKIIIQLEKKVDALRDLADSYKEQRDSYKNLFDNLRTIHQNYINKVTKGLDSLLDNRIIKI
jgi:3-hydroxy-3-methylglutaryl CoA synthase